MVTILPGATLAQLSSGGEGRGSLPVSAAGSPAPAGSPPLDVLSQPASSLAGGEADPSPAVPPAGETGEGSCPTCEGSGVKVLASGREISCPRCAPS